MRTPKLPFAATLVVACSLASPAVAQDTCDVAGPMDDQRFFRRLSIDLSGGAPSFAEITAMKARGTVDEQTVDSFLASDAFVAAMRDYHASLVWPNIDETPIVPDTHLLYPLELAPGEPVYLSPVRSIFVRAVGNGAIFTPCKNEPAEFDASGNVIATPLEVGGEVVAMQEGWVEVEPYWAPGTTVRVCAFDAQPNVSAVVCPGPSERYPFAEASCQQFEAFAESVQAPYRDTMVDCNSRTAIFAPQCGCGPNLAYCQTDRTAYEVRLSLLEQELRIIDEVVRDGRPYHEALTTKDIEFNGPIAHYLRNQARLSFDVEAEEDATAAFPEQLTYTDYDWVRTTRTGRHAGLLTTPGYLLRFTTWRGRAHRYYNAFECSSFIPNGPLPSPQDPCSEHEDLTKRCGCDACHEALEPMAAHWGRFSEFGFRHLDEARFPRQGVGRCTPPLASIDELIDCFRQYELDPVGEEQAYAGQLNAYVFRTGDEVLAVEEGPGRLVAASIASGSLASCTVQKMWTFFMRREPTPEERTTELPALVEHFEANGHDLKSVVKEIVLHPAYRRQP